MKIIVQKFGGTSVRNEEGRARAIYHLNNALSEGYKVVVVVSAMGQKVSRMQRIHCFHLLMEIKRLLINVSLICLWHAEN